MDRFTYAIVGGVLALVAVGLATAAVMRGREAPPDLTTPRGVTLAYAQAEQRGDGQTAWNLLAPAVQARADRDSFLARFASQPTGLQYLSTEAESLDQPEAANAQSSANGAAVVLVRTSRSTGGLFGSGSYSTRTTVRLVRDVGSATWRITVPPDADLLDDRF